MRTTNILGLYINSMSQHKMVSVTALPLSPLAINLLIAEDHSLFVRLHLQEGAKHFL